MRGAILRASNSGLLKAYRMVKIHVSKCDAVRLKYPQETNFIKACGPLTTDEAQMEQPLPILHLTRRGTIGKIYELTTGIQMEDVVKRVISLIFRSSRLVHEVKSMYI